MEIGLSLWSTGPLCKRPVQVSEFKSVDQLRKTVNFNSLRQIAFHKEGKCSANKPEKTAPTKSHGRKVNMVLLNSWSVCNKAISISDFIKEQDLNLLVLT